MYNTLNLYIVQYSYSIDEEVTNDIWTLACRSDEEVRKIMDLNCGEFVKHGITPIKYTFRKVESTDNNYEIQLVPRVKSVIEPELDDDHELIDCSVCGEEKLVEKDTWASEEGMCEQCYCAYQGG